MLVTVLSAMFTVLLGVFGLLAGWTTCVVVPKDTKQRKRVTLIGWFFLTVIFVLTLVTTVLSAMSQSKLSSSVTDIQERSNELKNATDKLTKDSEFQRDLAELQALEDVIHADVLWKLNSVEEIKQQIGDDKKMVLVRLTELATTHNKYVLEQFIPQINKAKTIAKNHDITITGGGQHTIECRLNEFKKYAHDNEIETSVLKATPSDVHQRISNVRTAYERSDIFARAVLAQIVARLNEKRRRVLDSHIAD